RVSRAIIGVRRRDCLRLSEIIHLHHPRHHGPACRLQDQRGRKARRQDQGTEGHEPPVPRLHAGGTYPFVPCLRGLLIGRLGFRRFAVMSCGSFEDAHERSLSERLTEEPEPWLSPERTAWAVMAVPWLRACRRCIRCAQAGGPSGKVGGAAAGAALAPPTVLMVELPPVAPKPAFAPAEKLDLTLSLAWDVALEAARLSGETAAESAARAPP